jgi:hypothetical protein
MPNTTPKKGSVEMKMSRVVELAMDIHKMIRAETDSMEECFAIIGVVNGMMAGHAGLAALETLRREEEDEDDDDGRQKQRLH